MTAPIRERAYGQRTVSDRLADRLSAKDHGAIGDDSLHTIQEWIVPGALGRFPSLAALQVQYPHVTSTNQSIDWAAIQSALTAAGRFRIADEPEETYAFALKGGAEVFLPRGCYWLGTSGPLEIPQNVSIRGVGCHSSVLRSSFNGYILRNDGSTAAGTGSYNREGTTLRDFGIIGDVTKPNQVGLGLLRWVSGVIDNVHISRTGGDGAEFRECGCGVINNLMTVLTGGRGIFIHRGVELTWGSPDNIQPSNGLTFNAFRAISTRGEGIEIEDYANGIVFNSAFVEYCSASANLTNTGQQIKIATNSYVPIVFNYLWSEGQYIATHLRVTATGAAVVLNGWRHFALGQHVDRALIADAGSVMLHEPHAPNESYPTIAGSNAPFRINDATVGIEVHNPVGAGITGIGWVEKMNGSKVGLFNNLYQTSRFGDYGTRRHFQDSGAGTSHEWYKDTDTVNPFMSVDTFQEGLRFRDAKIYRRAPRLLVVNNFLAHEAALTVSQLPAPNLFGAAIRGFVSDSSVAHAGNAGAVVVGGGSNVVPVYCDGSAWRIG